MFLGLFLGMRPVFGQWLGRHDCDEANFGRRIDFHESGRYFIWRWTLLGSDALYALCFLFVLPASASFAQDFTEAIFSAD